MSWTMFGTSYKWSHAVFFFLWLPYVNMWRQGLYRNFVFSFQSCCEHKLLFKSLFLKIIWHCKLLVSIWRDCLTYIAGRSWKLLATSPKAQHVYILIQQCLKYTHQNELHVFTNGMYKNRYSSATTVIKYW